MSVFYADDLSGGQGVKLFWRVLKRWRGSLYKLVWVDLLIFVCLYYALNLTYRFAMTDDQKRSFESLVKFCEKTKGNLPVSFLLGFFVSGIVARWYNIYMRIPWMNEVAMDVATTIHGRDELRTRKVRLTIMRYLNLSWILMMRLISDQIATRFSADEGGLVGGLRKVRLRNQATRLKIHRNTCHPWSIDQSQALTPEQPRSVVHSKQPSEVAIPEVCSVATPLAHIALPESDDYSPSPDAVQMLSLFKLRKELSAFNEDLQVRRTFGAIITPEEIETFARIASECYERTRQRYTPEYWIPIQWAQRIVLKALQSGYILDPKIAYSTVNALAKMRKQMQELQIFCSIMIPLVYTQVVIIAVYTYFMCQLFASQFVGSKDTIDIYIPVFAILSFLFLMGWLKVALCVMNPFGDDDEDFQTSSILDYNLEVSYRTVYMDSGAFPENLSFPLDVKLKEGEHNDLEDFLDKTDWQLNKSMSRVLDRDFLNYDTQPNEPGWKRKCLCCHHRATGPTAPPPNRPPVFQLSETQIRKPQPRHH
ncbi:unnamed protein product [Calicophoron daubneyi]|uniref:Bestrophin homolog n=1 Tax=Calicophoron daubneyi TaxID=300641 RepID=A0AAV2TX41_CALDB